MNEPTEFVFNGNLYIRFNYRAYKLPGQHSPFIHDTALLDKLEKAFSERRRAAAKGQRTSAPHDFTPRQRIGTPPRVHTFKTPRESRKGRVE